MAPLVPSLKNSQSHWRSRGHRGDELFLCWATSAMEALKRCMADEEAMRGINKIPERAGLLADGAQSIDHWQGNWQPVKMKVAN